MTTINKCIFGIDLGGTTINIGLINAQTGDIFDKYSSDINQEDQSIETIFQQIIDACEYLVIQKNKLTFSSDIINGIGMGAPGQISQDGVIVAASNFPDWKNIPMQKLIEDSFPNIPVVLINDADAAACAEAWIGAGRNKTMVMITLGTGVGFGIVMKNGIPFTGSRGLVEGGHMIMEMNGRKCGCGQYGCLETYTSGPNIVKRTKEILNYKEENIILPIPMVNCMFNSYDEQNDSRATITNDDINNSILNQIPINDLTCKDIFNVYAETALKPDKLAIHMVHTTAKYLALAILNICRLIDPEIIVLSGGVAQAGDLLITPLTGYYHSMGWKVLPHDIDIVQAKLQNDTGIIGAAAYCARKLNI